MTNAELDALAKGRRDALQAAWDEMDTLPPIIFSDIEAVWIVQSIANHLRAQEGSAGGESA